MAFIMRSFRKESNLIIIRIAHVYLHISPDPLLTPECQLGWRESYGDTLIVAVATRHNLDLRDYHDYIQTQVQGYNRFLQGRVTQRRFELDNSK